MRETVGGGKLGFGFALWGTYGSIGWEVGGGVLRCRWRSRWVDIVGLWVIWTDVLGCEVGRDGSGWRLH